jgi:restriction system protein
MSGPYQHTWEPMFSVLAYVFLGAFLVGALISLGRRFREVFIHRSQSSIHSIRSLSWSNFERLMVEAFRRQGYKAKRTADGPDGGIDIILRRNGKTTLVQCKQWKASRVGVKPIRELAGVVFGEKAHDGIFVCSGKYTNQATEFAKKSGIELIDGQRLVRMMKLESDLSDHGELQPVQQESACPKCGSRLVLRTARRGNNAGNKFLGCSAFPSCRYTRDA